MYASIWMALALFVAGEVGKRRGPNGPPPSTWAWRVWTLGALSAMAHMLIALAIRYGWSQDAAVRETARQTAMVYGVAWGGGVYVNYLFVTTWLAEAWWWRISPARYISRPRAVTLGLRIFYLLIIVNAAVVFASPSGRVLGVLLTTALVWSWSAGTAPKA